MRQDWEVKKLGEVLEIQRGGSPRPIKDFLTNSSDGVNWIKIGDAPNDDKYIYETKEKIKPEGIRCSRLVKEGDFILSNSMSFGRPYIMKTTGCIHDGWLVLRDEDKKINQDFLYYVLSSDLIYRQFDYLASGSTVRNLNINLVKKVEIPLPSLSEQQRIVEILDEALTGIATIKANTERNLQNARELFQSYLQSIFSNPSDDWEVKKLGDVCLIQPPKKEARNKLDNADLVSFVPMPDLGIDRKYIEATQVRPFEEVVKGYTYFADDDVLLAKITPCFENGKLGIADNLKNGVGFGSSEFIVFRTPDYLNNEFLYYFLSNDKFRREGATRMLGTAGQKRLAKDFLRNTLIPLPSLSQQQEIVKKLDTLLAETKRLEAIYQQKLNDLEELKKSILQKAFNGELTNG